LNKLGLNDEPQLIHNLRKGNELAFEVIFHRYKRRIKGFVHKMLPPNIDTDKIVQEVFIKVWIHREKIDQNKNFSAFLFAIAKNLVLDELKSAVNKKLVYTENNVLEEVMPLEEGSETSEQELELMLFNSLQKLPERRRQIFSLSRFEGLTYKQIATKLNITENTVDTQIRKSLKFLRREFSSFL